MSFDAGTVVILALAAALAGLLLGLLPGWRRVVGAGHQLPVWSFLRRQAASLGSRAALQAELRCALCGEQAECAKQLKAGAMQPPENCPNAALFAAGSADQSVLTKESRSAGRIPAA